MSVDDVALDVTTTSFSFSVGEFSVIGVTSGDGEWTKTLGFKRIDGPKTDIYTCENKIDFKIANEVKLQDINETRHRIK